VRTEKLALVLPACTVTLEGTVATEVLLLASVTSAPFAGAAALSVTVPVELLPPLRLDGFKPSDDRCTEEPGVIVMDAWTVLFPRLAVMFTAVLLRTPVLVVIVKVPVVAPAATVAVAGTSAKELSLLRPTTVPPDGAAALSVTVPVVVDPDDTVFGLMASEESTTPPQVVPPGFGVSWNIVP
jgi:hypothetical protein